MVDWSHTKSCPLYIMHFQAFTERSVMCPAVIVDRSFSYLFAILNLFCIRRNCFGQRSYLYFAYFFTLPSYANNQGPSFLCNIICSLMARSFCRIAFTSKTVFRWTVNYHKITDYFELSKINFWSIATKLPKCFDNLFCLHHI